MRKILFVLFLIGLLNACDEEKYHDIKDDTWLLLELNDTVIFNNNLVNDTFKLVNISHYYEYVDKTVYYENLDVDYKHINNLGNNENYIYSILRNYNTTRIYWQDFDKIILYSSHNTLSYAIESRVFENVYLIRNDSAEEDWEALHVYYTDNYGVIAYELYNGEVYEIDLNCLP